MKKLKTITLGDLKLKLDWMKTLPDDTEITFGGGLLSFRDAKTRLYKSGDKAPAIVDIEFNQTFGVTSDSDAAA